MTERHEDPLEKAILALLRPLVRLILKRGVAFGRFAELAKRAYVDVARRDFGVPGRKLTISRVAVLTGMTRKEASRLMQLESTEGDGSERRQVNRAARVVSAWVTQPAYQDAAGEPAVLPFAADEGVSFSDLVAAHGADVPARAVYDELLRVGSISLEEGVDGGIRLLERAYIPTADEATKLAILGSDVADLIASIDHNIDPETPVDDRFFQRKVAYDALPAEYLPALRRLLATRGQRLLEELDVDMAARDRDVQRDPNLQPRARAMVGLYYYEEEHDEED